MIESPQANLFQSLIEKLKTIDGLRYIDQDIGQLEHYEMRPAVSWPCCLIDIAEFNYSDQQNFLTQLAEGIEAADAQVEMRDRVL